MKNQELIGQCFGPLQGLIEDESVEEIWINTPNRIFIARHGRSELTNLVLSKEIVHDLIERLLIWGGRRLDVSNPFVDARLPDGSRLHVAIPEVTAAHWAVNIRKHLTKGLLTSRRRPPQISNRSIKSCTISLLSTKFVSSLLPWRAINIRFGVFIQISSTDSSSIKPCKGPKLWPINS